MAFFADVCTGSVRYGPVTVSTGAIRATSSSATSIMCENVQFGGDPAPGIQKHCECNEHDLSLGEAARSTRFVVEKEGKSWIHLHACQCLSSISPFVYTVEGRCLRHKFPNDTVVCVVRQCSYVCRWPCYAAAARTRACVCYVCVFGGR